MESSTHLSPPYNWTFLQSKFLARNLYTIPFPMKFDLDYLLGFYWLRSVSLLIGFKENILALQLTELIFVPKVNLKDVMAQRIIICIKRQIHTKIYIEEDENKLHPLSQMRDGFPMFRLYSKILSLQLHFSAVGSIYLYIFFFLYFVFAPLYHFMYI